MGFFNLHYEKTDRKGFRVLRPDLASPPAFRPQSIDFGGFFVVRFVEYPLICSTSHWLSTIVMQLFVDYLLDLVPVKYQWIETLPPANRLNNLDLRAHSYQR